MTKHEISSLFRVEALIQLLKSLGIVSARMDVWKEYSRFSIIYRAGQIKA